MAKSKPKKRKNAPTHYRCRVDVSVVSVTEESSRRLGPGMLISAEEFEELIANGACRADCFEPVKPTRAVKRVKPTQAVKRIEQDDATTNRS